MMPAPTSPYDFNAEYDAEADDPIETEAPQAGAAKPAGVVAPQPAASGKEAPSVPKHSAFTIGFAKDLGIDDAEIAAMSPKELETAVRLAHRTMLKVSQDFRRNEFREATPAAPAPQAAPIPAAEKPEEDEYAEFAEEVAPSVLAAIKKGRAADKKVIEQLQAKVGEFEGERQARAREQMYDAVDQVFAQMPAEVKKLIGEGSRSEIKSPVHRALRRQILADAEGDRTEGLSFAQKMQKAAATYAPAAAEVEEESTIAEGYEVPVVTKGQARQPDGTFGAKPAAEREAAWKDAGTAKPTQRENPLPKGERLAIQTARKVMLKRGMLDESDLPADAFPA